jgi:CO dehydrogenase nickel-insertion accessory protein CooC1
MWGKHYLWETTASDAAQIPYCAFGEYAQILQSIAQIRVIPHAVILLAGCEQLGHGVHRVIDEVVNVLDRGYRNFHLKPP